MDSNTLRLFVLSDNFKFSFEVIGVNNANLLGLLVAEEALSVVEEVVGAVSLALGFDLDLRDMALSLDWDGKHVLSNAF